jgi:hypothetical protein
MAAEFHFVNSDNVGVYVLALTIEQVETQTNVEGTKRIRIRVRGIDPRGKGELELPVDDAKALRDELNKCFPTLGSVPGGKK